MGKYTYETRPDLTKDQKAYIKTSSECTIQTWIANELGEANRLKIIELSMLKINLGIAEKFDLEDRA